MKQDFTNFKYLGKPALITGFVIFCLLILLKFGLAQINKLNASIDEATQIKNLLTQKIVVLEKVDNILPGDITFVDVALPSRGSTLFALSQIKFQSVQFGVTVSNLRAGNAASDDNGLTKNPLSFDVHGDDIAILGFLKSLSKSLPLMDVDRFKITNEGDERLVSVIINVYSAGLPEKIPAVDSAVNDLAENEIKILSEIADYLLPQFVEPKANEGAGKIDPFN